MTASCDHSSPRCAKAEDAVAREAAAVVADSRCVEGVVVGVVGGGGGGLGGGGASVLGAGRADVRVLLTVDTASTPHLARRTENQMKTK